LAKRFQRKRFLEIDQSETRIACGGHVCTWIGTKLALFNRGPLIDLYSKCSYLYTDFLKSSLKPLGQMNQNLVGSIYERSSIKEC
jgi:hypothetical protein